MHARVQTGLIVVGAVAAAAWRSTALPRPSPEASDRVWLAIALAVVGFATVGFVVSLARGRGLGRSLKRWLSNVLDVLTG